jgi:hypothetical protein
MKTTMNIKYKLFICLILLLTTLISCSTLRLPKDATPAEKRAALCADAQMGYSLSLAMLENLNPNAAENNYWLAYKMGAAAALKLYCPGL